AHRFDGEAGSLVEAFVKAGSAVSQVVLAGVGNGSEVDYERAGGAISARFGASGRSAVAVDFSALPGAPTAKAAARLAAGAV
ncbi:hypothetical protein ABTK55_20065, partial [Acinetobacter baumannii]